tara:strand:- start:206 stop:1021 length:816 start_codon:yes stop_codon:yes gene_type:complete
MITNKDIKDYKRDGVICIRNAISDQLIEVSRRGIGQSIAKPGRFFRDYTATDSPARYIFEFWNWWNIRELEELAFDNSIASMVASIIEAEKVLLLMDQWFHREAGSTNAATWHHDEPYFDFFEGKKCVVWFPLEDTQILDGLTFIRGSHRWNKLFMAQNFATGKAFQGHTKNYSQMSNFSDLTKLKLSWDMKKGDCLIFDFRTIHRATLHTGPSSTAVSRISFRYGDKDVIFKPRGPWTAELSSFLIQAGQKVDSPLKCPYLPVIFDSRNH